MSRLRRKDELAPLPVALQRMVDGGDLIDYRATLPVHNLFGLKDHAYDKARRVVHWNARDVTETVGVVIHHSGSDNDDPIATAEYHTNPGEHISKEGDGLPTLAYHFVVTRVEQPPLLAVEPSAWVYATGAGANRYLLSIVALGRFDTYRDPPDGQQNRLWRLVDQLSAAFEFNPRCVFGHFDFGKPSCPGPAFRAEIERRQQQWSVKNGIGTVREWQQLLSVPDDGIVGPVTRRALAEFQRANGLPLTGSFDRLTEIVLLQLSGRYPI